MSRLSTLAILLLVFALCLPASADEATSGSRPGVYYWLWWKNLDGDWKTLIDFSAEQKVDGVVIWGLQGWKGDGARCREVVEYAHKRGVKVIHGLGLNGYEIGAHLLKEHPELAATIPQRLAETKKAAATRRCVFCPSHPKAKQLLRELLIKTAETGIDGFNFETADVDYLTCHCEKCEERFKSKAETEHQNKPIEWPLEHLEFAADVLSESHPDLWLTCEFAMQRFGRAPYVDCERILELNRRVDPRITVIWAEATAPPEEIAKRLRAERTNLGWYIRTGAIYGDKTKDLLQAETLKPIAKRLKALDPKCFFYRGYLPKGRYAENMATAAGVLLER